MEKQASTRFENAENLIKPRKNIIFRLVLQYIKQDYNIPGLIQHTFKFRHEIRLEYFSQTERMSSGDLIRGQIKS